MNCLRTIGQSKLVTQKIKDDLQQRDPDPKARQEKKEKAMKTLQLAVNKKAAENKAALEMIRRRQEEARQKHVGARERASKISEMKKQLKSLGQDIKIEEVVALVREENKDIEEAVVATVPTPESARGGAAQHEAGHSASVLREAATADPGDTATIARSVVSAAVTGARVAQTKPQAPDANVLEPSAILAVMLSPEIVNPPLNTSVEVAEEQIGIFKQEATFMEEGEASAVTKSRSIASVKSQASAKGQASSHASGKGQESVKSSPEDQGELYLYRGNVNVFGGEKEIKPRSVV